MIQNGNIGCFCNIIFYIHQVITSTQIKYLKQGVSLDYKSTDFHECVCISWTEIFHFKEITVPVDSHFYFITHDYII